MPFQSASGCTPSSEEREISGLPQIVITSTSTSANSDHFQNVVIHPRSGVASENSQIVIRSPRTRVDSDHLQNLMTHPRSDVASDNSQIVSSLPRTSDDSNNLDVNQPSKSIIAWNVGDPQNPANWSRPRKVYVVFCCILLVANSTINSSIAAGASEETGQHYGITDRLQLVMPTSLYLIGYILGPLVSSPLSESYGRKPVIYSTHLILTAFSVGVALAPTWTTFVVMRLLCGVGSAMAVVGGIYADVYKSQKARGMVFMISITCSVLGPIVGPTVGSLLAGASYRSAYWLPVAVAAITWPVILLMPETFSPVLLRRKAAALQRETGDSSVMAPTELEKRDLNEIVTVILVRPFKMLFTEAIVLTSCLYMGLFYALFYVLLQAFSIIYKDTYKFNKTQDALTFVAIAVGILLADVVYLLWDYWFHRQRARQSPPKWVSREEYRRLPLACIAGPLFVISMLWLGWTARFDVHWIVPVLAGVPFGLAYLLMFMGMINYIVDAYTTYSASALAAASCTRSILAVGLPFAIPSMFSKLGIAWACSLLGLMSLAIGTIPFLLVAYGSRLQASSKMCQALQRTKKHEVGELSDDK